MNYSFLLESVWHPPLAFEEVSAPSLPPEIELQALWFSGAFGKDFRLKDGRTLTITQFGEWNLGPGPDFSRVAIEIDGSPFTGDLELDSKSSDWESHGHSTNPAFTNTILHVAFEANTKEMFIRTANHRQVPELLIPPNQVSEALALPTRQTAISVPGRCIAPLKRISKLSLERLFKEAATRRANQKALRFSRTVEANGFDSALFQATAETLGYGGNSLPMRLLAQRAPIRTLLSNPADAEAILLGTAGFLSPEIHLQAPEDTREYLSNLWETWWKLRSQHEPSISGSPDWKTHGQRPANHPHRRVGGLSELIQNWRAYKDLVRASPFSAKKIADFLQGLQHEFWSHHHTLGSKRSQTAISVYGRNLAMELCANHLVPLAIQESRFSYHDYYKLRHSAINQKLKRCGIRLFGTEERAKPHLRRIPHQQAMLQLYHDFCLEDTSACEQCPFPEQLSQWK